MGGANVGPEGKCRYCNKIPLPAFSGQNFRVCEQHYLAYTARSATGNRTDWKVLLEILEKQNRKCAYTGIPIVLGVNASIDHKFPRSRFPHLKDDPDNLQWVTKSVNGIKKTMTHDEFVSVAKERAARYKSLFQQWEMVASKLP